ncbi:MAG: hypothetical protein AAF236_17900, partial [Verrucomicrobiota bacterium]
MDRASSHLRARLVVACGGVVLLLSLLSARLLYLEQVDGDRLAEEARSHYEYREVLDAQRGRIFDRAGELLARNQTVYKLVVDCRHLRDQGLACIGLAEAEQVSPQTIRKRYLPEEILGKYREYVAEVMSKPLRLPKHELARKLKEKTRGEIVLAKNIEDDFAQELDGILNRSALGGIYLRRGERRFYPSPLSLTQVVGFVDEDGIGVSGVEKAFD